MFGAHYLHNGSRYGLGASGPRIGNGYLGIKWSRDRWRNVILKGQGHDPNLFTALYLENGWRYRLGSNGLPIGNELRFEWSRDWWRHDPDRSRSIGQGQGKYASGPISRKQLQWSTYRKWLLGDQMVTWRYLTWRMTSHDPERSRSWHVTLKVINSWSTAV